MLRVVAVLVPILIVGCAGKVDYVRPTAYIAPQANVMTVERPRDLVWNASVAELGKKFFVINNLDKSSGLMNISYTGNPESYVDCGRITSFVKNAQGERTYEFAGAKEQQSYEVMNPGVGLFFVDRRMNLEGRVNLIFEEVGPNTTRVTANTRYVVTRKLTGRRAGNNIPQTTTEAISFTSASGSSFPANSGNKSTDCVSNGVLEREILSAIK